MSEVHHDRVEQILVAALDLSPEKRVAYVDGACHDDEALQTQIKELLEAHGRADDCLNYPSDSGPVDHDSRMEGQRFGRTLGARTRTPQSRARGAMGRTCGRSLEADRSRTDRRRAALK